MHTPRYKAFYAYKASREIRRLHVKRGIVIVSAEILASAVHTPRYKAFYAYKASTEIRRLHVKRGIVIVSAEICATGLRERETHP